MDYWPYTVGFLTQLCERRQAVGVRRKKLVLERHIGSYALLAGLVTSYTVSDESLDCSLKCRS